MYRYPGHFLISASREVRSFRVFEDNVEQEIVNFSSEDVPISFGVILDLSGSMANKIGEAKQAAMQFFKSANPEDEFLHVTVSEHAQLSSGFTTSIEDLGNSFHDLRRAVPLCSTQSISALAR